MASSAATIGGLDKKEVHRVINRVQPKVSRCVRKGRSKLAILGGDIGIEITIDESGRASEVFLYDSSLGHHEVELCIVDAFRKAQWPRPVGGKVGKVDQTFSFSAAHHEPPLDWTADKLKNGMAKEAEDGEDPWAELMSALHGCRSDAGTGPITVTMYLDEDGFVQAVGMGVSDAKGEAAVECVQQTIKTTSFPAPEDNFAKVTLEVR